MNKQLRPYAPVGLIVAALGLLALLGAAAMKGFVFAGLYTPPSDTLINNILWGGLAGLVLGLAAYALLDPERTRRMLTGRQAQRGSNSLILLAAFTGVLVVANVLAFQYPQRIDLTESKENTLAPETIQTLEALQEPVQALAFYSPAMGTEVARQLLDNFKTYGGGKFDFEFVDPESNPALAQDAGVTGDGKIVLVMGERKEIVSYASEEDLTIGLVRLLNPQKNVIYFTTGHGERDLESGMEDSYTSIRYALENKNYTVKAVNLLAEKKIPDDAYVLVVAGPIKGFTQDEITLIRAYLAGGGSLVALMDPIVVADYGEGSEGLTTMLADDWGIVLNDDLITDPSSSSSAFHAVSYAYAYHPITEKLQGIASIFPNARSITIKEVLPEGVTSLPLIKTIDQAWGETDLAALIENKVPEYNEGTDLPGPLNLVAISESAASGARIVVIGNSSFAQDGNFSFSANGDVLINSIDWAVRQENLINLTPRELVERTFVPPSNTVMLLMIVTGGCLIPLVVVGGGVYAWIARRKRG